MGLGRLKTGCFLVLGICSVAAGHLHAQGGPPMITDDPGTPGNGHWENNFAITLAHRPDETVIGSPLMDLNYGWGDHIQLTLQTPLTILERSGHGPLAGLGGTQAAVKWRFIDEETSGFALSIFPRLLFTILHSSVRRGLADDGTRFQIPVEVSKKIGSLEIGGECGPLASSVGRSEWIYGAVGGVELSDATELMAELNGTSRMNFDQDTLTLNFGVRQKLSKHSVLIVSLGHDVRAPDDEPLALVGYFGVQLLY